MYVRCDESSLYSRINYVHSLTGSYSAGVSGIVSDAHRFSMEAYCIVCRPGTDTEETGRYDLAWKRFV